MSLRWVLQIVWGRLVSREAGEYDNKLHGSHGRMSCPHMGLALAGKQGITARSTSGYWAYFTSFLDSQALFNQSSMNEMMDSIISKAPSDGALVALLQFTVPDAGT